MTVHSPRAVGVLDIGTHSPTYSTSLLEESILKMEGVSNVKVNNIHQKVTVEFDPSVTTFEKIRAKVRQIV